MPDAAPTPPPPPQVFDAGVVDATALDAKKDASWSHSSHPGTQGSGEVEISAADEGYLTITIDSVPRGDTPKTIPLSPGPHKLHLSNENGFKEDSVIKIESGKTLKLTKRTKK